MFKKRGQCKAYNGPILNGYNLHIIYHCENEFARGKNHVNGIESFWSYSKRRHAKFNGLTYNKFFLYLKNASLDSTIESKICIKFCLTSQDPI